MTMTWWLTTAMATLVIVTAVEKALAPFLARFASNWSPTMGIDRGPSFNAVTNFIWVSQNLNFFLKNYFVEFLFVLQLN